MKQRCNYTKYAQYKDYGARGIAVCERWEEFDNFLADMGERPPGTSLDRIDNDGPYSPQNCRWATREQQNTNQRQRKDAIVHGGVPLARYAEENGLTYAAAWQRHKRGLLECR